MNGIFTTYFVNKKHRFTHYFLFGKSNEDVINMPNNKIFLIDNDIKKIYCYMNCDESINYDITNKIM